MKKCALDLIYTCRPVDVTNGHTVASFRYNLGASLVETVGPEMPQDIEYVVPVPNSGLFYAMGFAGKLGKPYYEGILKKNTEIRFLSETDSAIRENAIRNNFVILSEKLKGKNIALLDEAVFTGTTLKAVCDILRNDGVGKIYIFIPTCKVVTTCEDLPQTELLAPRCDTEGMRKYLGADGLWFQDSAVFRRATQDIAEMCTECFEKL